MPDDVAQLQPEPDAVLPRFRHDVLEGLSRTRKALPAKYFYDLKGSLLFEQITRLPEYYPTRTELGILRSQGASIGALCPPRAALIEFGSGSTVKMRCLLSHLRDLAAYVPVDVSVDFMGTEVAQLRSDTPELDVVPVAADFTRPFALPTSLAGRPRIGFFPGSTIGNFEPGEAELLLATFAGLLGREALLIIGVDLVKEVAVLESAYNDAAGVTAQFNLNLLRRINSELGADFDLGAFAHRAFFDAALSRIEMHLVSRVAQQVRIAGQSISFAAGETIHTENSYKYTPAGFEALAARSGWRLRRMFTDPDRLFSVLVLRAD
jgi:dimethylhistidine N-methyltransferase